MPIGRWLTLDLAEGSRLDHEIENIFALHASRFSRNITASALLENRRHE
jgi:hypothetical protein